MYNIIDLIKKYAIERYVSSGIIAMIDIIISTIASILTIVVVEVILANISISTHTAIQLVISAIIATLIGVLAMRTHRIIIRHSTISDIWKLAIATLIKEMFIAICVITLLNFYELNLVVILIKCVETRSDSYFI